VRQAVGGYAPYGIIFLTRGESDACISCIRSSCRSTRGDFRRRKWLFMPFVRMIFPVPVTLKRRAAPLCVLSLGFFGFFALLTWMASFPLGADDLLLQGSDDHGHGPTLHLRCELDGAAGAELLGQLN